MLFRFSSLFSQHPSFPWDKTKRTKKIIPVTRRRGKKCQLGFPCHMFVIIVNGALGVETVHFWVVHEDFMNNFWSCVECYRGLIPEALWFFFFFSLAACTLFFWHLCGTDHALLWPAGTFPQLLSHVLMMERSNWPRWVTTNVSEEIMRQPFCEKCWQTLWAVNTIKCCTRQITGYIY